MKSRTTNQNLISLAATVIIVVAAASNTWAEPRLIDDFKNGIRPEWKIKEVVSIEGEVRFPGSYTMKNGEYLNVPNSI